MNWIGTYEVKKAALRSHKAAVQSSLDHWNQLYKATPEEIKEVNRNTYGCILKAGFCALCQRYYKIGTCGKCPLVPKNQNVGCAVGSLWSKARSALENFVRGEGSWEEWKQRSKAMRDRLKKILTDLNKPKKISRQKVFHSK